jgi:hypothetical protein
MYVSVGVQTTGQVFFLNCPFSEVTALTYEIMFPHDLDYLEE